MAIRIIDSFQKEVKLQEFCIFSFSDHLTNQIKDKNKYGKFTQQINN
jgi:hypothetical protein